MLLCPGFPRQEYWSRLPFPSPGDLPDPGIEPRSPTLWVNSSPAEPQGKAKNTGVGSLSLLFPIQELNPGLLHCRQILYQLSYTVHLCYLLILNKCQRIDFSALSPTLTSIHDYWKNHRFDYIDLCQQSDVSAFYYAASVCHI